MKALQKCSACALAFAAVVSCAGLATAADQTVTNLLDSGAGSLRQAIIDAPAGGEVDFQAGLNGAINLTSGELLIDKDLTVTGPGSDQITVDAGGLSRVFHVGTGASAALSGLTLSSGSAAVGGAILSEASLTLTNCVVQGSSATAGGGIYSDSSGALTVTGSTIRLNGAELGGGLFIEEGPGTARLEADTIIEGNAAKDGGGIASGDYAAGGAVLQLIDCIVRNNDALGGGPLASNLGGGILTYGPLTVTTSEIHGNTADVGGGIASAVTSPGSPNLSIIGSNIHDNSAQIAGGVFNQGVATITAASAVSNNEATGGTPFASAEGGGVYNAEAPSSLAVVGSTVSGNRAQVGGGVFNLGSLTVTGSTLSGNCATNAATCAAAVTAQGAQNKGGAIATAGDLLIDSGSVVASNSSGYGGGIFSENVAATVQITNSEIRSNTAALSGGGLGNGGSALGGAAVTFDHATVSGNSAGEDGGGLSNYGSMSITNGSTVSGNTANGGGGLLNGASTARVCAADIGAACISDADCGPSGVCGEFLGVMSVVDSTVERNVASLGGGMRNRAMADVSRSTMSRNKADFGGAVYNDAEQAVSVFNSTLSDNRAGLTIVDPGAVNRVVTVDPEGGGAIYNAGGSVAVASCTIRGGSIANSSGYFLVTNSILAGSPKVRICSGDNAVLCAANADCADLGIGTCILGSDGNCAGPIEAGENPEILSDGYNIDSGLRCGFTSAGDQRNVVNPGLGPLQDNGGPTATHALLASSPAIDAAHPSTPSDVAAPPVCFALDQRSVDRELVGTPRCDIGAFEGTCGNGVTDPGESCDDGNQTNGDGCDDGPGGTCKPSGCGNGAVAGSEVCDDGNTSDNDYCASSGTCTAPAASLGNACTADSDCDVGLLDGRCSACDEISGACGDSIVQENEACDDHNTSNRDSCVSGCNAAACGDGYLCSLAGCTTGPTGGVEECDDGNLRSGDGCDADCRAEFCGDGVVNNGVEQCDDGNTVNDDGCTAACRIAVCGDGNLDSGAGEECDDGNVVNGDGCSAGCKVEGCSNGAVDVGEECDDGNATNGDGCDDDVALGGNCTQTRCGNGVTTGTEACDDGNSDNGDYCDSSCVSTGHFCGDGTRETNEECDDGNAGNGDGCDALCRAESCGDGIINNGAGVEACDDGNTAAGDYCAADCSAITGYCGDGRTQAAVEDCDAGAETPGCDADCTTVVCGDGETNEAAGETCDPPFAAGTGENRGCNATCDLAVCGDSVIDDGAGEECDDGNTSDDDGCDSNCTATRCGNGIVAGAEACDDGNADDGDYCAADCGAVTGSCGDGVLQPGAEACDSAGIQTANCEQTCTRPVCGDGIANPLKGEACDDGNLAGNDYCSADCRAVTGSCGDGLIQTAVEQCDDAATDTAACDGDCTFPVCGDARVNTAAGEGCDDGNLTLADLCPDGPGGTCQAATCGDSIACDDTAACGASFEACDSGAVNALECDYDCTFPLCGDLLWNAAAGEDCDDDVSCSETCGIEGLQTVGQQECIASVNKAANRLAKAQTGQTTDCVTRGESGDFADAQECLSEDERGKVQRRIDQVDAAMAACTEVPGFAFGGTAGVVATAVITESGAAMNDIFGADLDDAIIREKDDRAGHRCQSLLAKTANKLFATQLLGFLRCKTKKLEAQSVTSALALATICFGELRSDDSHQGRIAKTAARLAKARSGKCATTDLDTALPGDCVGQVGGAFDTCVVQRFACRACRMLNGIDRLPGDCDVFDDGLANASCP